MAKRLKSETVDVGLRLKELLRAKVERAAKERGVSMNAEIVSRLERSFERQGLLEEVLTLAYGPEWGAFLMKAHEHGILHFRDQDREIVRKALNAFIDSLPSKGEAKK